MTPERFQQLRNLFDAAVERTPAERAAFLEQACHGDDGLRQEAARLVAAHESTTRVMEESIPAPGLLRTDPESREGGRIGPYEILRKLGRGGMGSVYLARRADEAFQKLVAVKILRADIATADLVRRFQREREILAKLEHPNVTRLLDAGTTDDNLPYFVMEYVEGKSIVRYCDEAHLPVEERLRLYRQVCDAVAYAHRHGIVHRDLKPGNILVAQGQVKVLDFGIARVTRGDAGDETLTEASVLMMTPQYASPEQVRGEAATRQSDVYALGVILYELLTGHSPYHLRSRIYHEIIRVVCEEVPTRPSLVIATPIETDASPAEPRVIVAPETAGRLRQASLEEWKEQLQGDLDAVMLKALSKQPMDRYNSPEQLGDDLERHSKGERVWARDISWWTRWGLEVSRHRGKVIGAGAAIAAVMSGAVSLHFSAFFYALGAAVLFFLWYAATDRELGRKIAGSFLTSERMVAILVLLAVLPANWFSGGAIVLGWIPEGIALVAIIYVVAWTFRERWTGALIDDFTDPGGNPVWIVYGLFFLAETAATLPKVWRGQEGWADYVAEHAFLLALVLVTYLTGRREIRQAGIVTGGHLLRWGRIRSWSFTDDERLSLFGKSEKVILEVELHRRIQFLPPVRLRVNASERDALNAIMMRHLGEWPE